MEPRKLVLFLLGVVFFIAALLAELGLGFALGAQRVGAEGSAPGLGISALALVDAGLAWTLLWMTYEFLQGPGWIGRIQGIVTLILSFLGVLGGLLCIFLIFTLLTLMVGLLLAAPFGTIAYLALWGDFPSAQVRGILAFIMMAKLAGLVALVLASPAMVKNKGLLVLLIFSLGATFITGFLIALVPGFVAAIADVIGALIAAILGTIWLFVMLIGAIFAVIRAIRSVVPD